MIKLVSARLDTVGRYLVVKYIYVSMYAQTPTK